MKYMITDADSGAVLAETQIWAICRLIHREIRSRGRHCNIYVRAY